MSSGATYVAAAYGVMGFTLVIYLVVAAMKRARLMREAQLLGRLQAAGSQPTERADDATSSLEPVDS